MADSAQPDPTVPDLLAQTVGGDAAALSRLLDVVYAELRNIAAAQMRGERPDHTLQPTALVHEAYVRLVGSGSRSFEDRTHFINAASRVMRRVLIDHARARNAAKRGGNLQVTLDEGIAGRVETAVDALSLDDALTRLAAAEPRWAQVVELRFFGGLQIAEVAALLGVSAPTVKRDWQFARAWLARELGDGLFG